MHITHHRQQTGYVTFVAKREGDKLVSIDAYLSTLTASGVEPLTDNAEPGRYLDIHTVDPLPLIETTDATAFQKSVWMAITQIKPGNTISYGQLAAQIGRPKAVRAVANACGANRFAGVIPCHRVTGSGGKLGGYRWGMEVKAALLASERSVRHNLEQA